MSEIDNLEAALPGMVEKLTTMMRECLTMYRETNSTLEDMIPSVSLEYQRRDGGRDLRITLSIDYLTGDSNDACDESASSN